MSKKENTTVKIKCDTIDTANGILGYLQAYTGDISRNINNMLRQMGKGQTDISFQDINQEKLTISITANPTDKGSVIVLEDGELDVCNYKDLNSGELYGFLSESGVTVFLFNKGGFDTPVQSANNMNILKDMLLKLPEVIESKRMLEESKSRELSEVSSEEISSKESNLKKS